MKFKITLAAIFITALAMAASAQSNGSFENGTDPGAYTTVEIGQTNISDWTVFSGNVDYIGSYWQASDGDRSIDMNGLYQAGEIRQTVATVLGVTYVVAFDMSGNPDVGAEDKVMSVGVVGGTSQTYHYMTGTNTHEDMQWAHNTFSFTATGSATALSFKSLMEGSAWGPALDNVTVTAVSGSRVCHRDNGRPVGKTLTVGVSAVPAHLAHGDTLGPCS
jgi:choice-of-anchor C domain-containing protein